VNVDSGGFPGEKLPVAPRSLMKGIDQPMANSLGKKSAAKKSAKKAGASGGKSGRMIYYFGAKRCDGDGTMKALLGGKGANLAQMTKIGLPVPPGFTITTQVCID
jgi:pyruvate,orthophosphate dikinase